jgi:hypothetical protein
MTKIEKRKELDGNTGSSSKRSPLKFFILVYTISIPLWVINAIFPMKNLAILDMSLILCRLGTLH